MSKQRMSVVMCCIVLMILPSFANDEDLLGLWLCNEGEGNIVTDSSGNGHDGVFVFGDPGWTDGVSGSAIELITENLVEVPALNIEISEATMAGWYKPYGPQPNWSAVLFVRGTSATGFNIVNGFGLGYHWNNDSALWSYDSGVLLVDNEWSHVAMTVDASKATFYLNGEEAAVNELAHAPALLDGNLYLGGDENADWGVRRMNGALDEVALYSRALDATEVKTLTLKAPVTMPAPPDALGLWLCNEGEGTVVSDSSGNGLDGTFVDGDPAWIEGVHGTAIELDGATLVKMSPLDMELSEATMAGWIKPYGEQPDWASLLMMRGNGNATGINIYGGLELTYHWNDMSALWSYTSGVVLEPNEWSHVALTVDPEKGIFYLNGEEAAVNLLEHTPVMFDADLYLGGDGVIDPQWGVRRMVGALDEVALYSRALDPNEIEWLLWNEPTVPPKDDPYPALVNLTFDAKDVVSVDDNDPESTLIAVDVTGNGYDGIISGQTVVEGILGEALAFDGSDGVTLVDSNALPLDNADSTVMLWLNTTSDSSMDIFTHRSVTADNVPLNRAMVMNVDDSGVGVLTLGHSEVGVCEGTTTINDGEWHHVAYTQAYFNSRKGHNETITLYVDGQVDGKALWISTLEGDTSTFVANVGGGGTLGDPIAFHGLIDEFKIFDSRLEIEGILATSGVD